ncbi:hypothetical protein FOFC_20894 [Fusarium oxysporum]|nr:hypothetical protein FOFC_20894 [Fusarium oxysporum]
MEQKGSELFQAACAGKDEDVQALLERGDIDINHLYNGMTALEGSILNLQNSTALLLIKEGASLEFKDGTNALHGASRCGLLEVAEAVINKGLNVKKRSRGNAHPIQCAAQSQDLDMITFLLDKGAKIPKFWVNPLSEDEDAQNPFTNAWGEQRYDIFLTLLDTCLSLMCHKEKNKCLYGINEQPSGLARKMEIHPSILGVIFAALPRIGKEYAEKSWIITILFALSKKGLPFTFDNVKSEIGNMLLQ